MHNNHNLLKGLTIVVTRPVHQTQALYDQITAWGGNCLIFPSLIIAPLINKQQLESVFSTPPSIDKFIFTSANAVTAVMPYWPNSKSAQILAIGPGTAQALAHHCLHARIPNNEEYTSEGLLRLPELKGVYSQKILIFSGLGGKEVLEKTLTAKGAQVQKIVVYQRLQPDSDFRTDLNWRQKIDFLISTSCESLESLYTMLHPIDQGLVKNVQLVVISEKMRALATTLGFRKPPLVAKNASDAEILNVLATAAGKG